MDENNNKINNSKIKETTEQLEKQPESKKTNSITKTGSSPKNSFVPSYNKKDEKGKMANGSKNKNAGKELTKKSKITIAIISVAIIAIIVGVIFFVSKLTNVTYGKYDKLMDDYGLSALYDNGTSKPNEKVTKSEAMKMILAATYNIDEIKSKLSDELLYDTSSTNLPSYSEYVTNKDGTIDLDKVIEYNQKLEEAKVEVTEKYTNEYWVRYANSMEFFNGIEEITDKNYNDSITYIDVIRYAGYAKSSILDKTLDTNFEPKFSDYEKYTNEEKMAIADMAYNKIIEDSNKKLNGNKKLKKGQFNKLIVNYILKYNLITINGEKININEEKMPSNKDEYPYTLASINKSVYEKEMYKKNDKFQNPKELFGTLKKYYEQITREVEEYYNAVLNVNYETIDNQEFHYAVSNFYTETDKLNSYVKYVKDNKIKVQGTAKVQNPVIYYDGEDYRVRVKLEYEVKETSKLKNVLYGDTDTSYKLQKQTEHIDLPIFINTTYNEISIKALPIDTMIAGKIK